MTHAEIVLERFGRLDKHLQSKGFPATSPWWRQTLRTWYLSGKRQLVARVGRRGGKSSTLCRLAVVEALYGKHHIPPGDVGVIAIISTRKEEATERLRTVMAILDALGVRYRTELNTISLIGRPVMFRVYTASVQGVSGFTAIFIIGDEVAKWKDLDTGTNPATEVLRSVRPTLATQPNGRIVLSSSPMGTLDAHYDAYQDGETEMQTTAHAPTWIANPTLTEESTRALESDELFWSREYGAIPQAEHERSLLSQAQLKGARDGVVHVPEARYRYVAAMDPATRGNAWTLIVATQDEHQVRRVVLAKEWRGTRARPLVPGEVLADIRAHLEPYGLRHVYTDQYSGDALKEIAMGKGLLLSIEPWTQALKAESFERLKSLLGESRLRIVEDAQVEADLLAVRLRLTRHGESYELISHGARHADYAPAIAMAVSHARIRALPPEETLSFAEQAERQKTSFLLGLKKERERAEKHGTPPITHRRWSMN